MPDALRIKRRTPHQILVENSLQGMTCRSRQSDVADEEQTFVKSKTDLGSLPCRSRLRKPLTKLCLVEVFASIFNPALAAAQAQMTSDASAAHCLMITNDLLVMTLTAATRAETAPAIHAATSPQICGPAVPARARRPWIGPVLLAAMLRLRRPIIRSSGGL